MRMLENLHSNLQAQVHRSPLWLRWQQLPERDRLALLLLAGFLGAVLVYLLLWKPVQQHLLAARSEYVRQVELHQYLLTHADQARQSARQPQQTLSADALQGLVTRSAEAAGLSIERIDNDHSGLQINLAPSAFATLLTWLYELQNSGVVLDEVNLERADSAQVLARLSLTVVP